MDGRTSIVRSSAFQALIGTAKTVTIQIDQAKKIRFKPS